MSVDTARIERAVSELLAAIGEDPERDGLVKTPHRVAKMYKELFAGLGENPADHLEVTFASEHDEMVMVRDIPFASLCEHHLVPFIGSLRGVQDVLARSYLSNFISAKTLVDSI